MGSPNPNSLANLELGRKKPPDWGKMLRTRHRLVDACVRVMHQEFREGGRKAIQRMRDEHPDKFILAIIGLGPKNLEVSGTIQHAHLHAAITDPQVWLKAVTDSTVIEQSTEVIQQTVESGLQSLIKASDSENTELDDSSDPADDNT